MTTLYFKVFDIYKSRWIECVVQAHGAQWKETPVNIALSSLRRCTYKLDSDGTPMYEGDIVICYDFDGSEVFKKQVYYDQNCGAFVFYGNDGEVIPLYKVNSYAKFTVQSPKWNGNDWYVK